MARPTMRRLSPPVLALLLVLWAPPSSSAQESPSVLLTILSQTSWNCPMATAELTPAQQTWSCPTGRTLVLRFRAQNLGTTTLDELAIGVTLYSRVLSRSAYEASLVSDPTLVIDAGTLPREGVIEPGATRDFEVSLLLDSGIDPDHSGVYPLKVDLRSGITSVAALRTPAIFLVRQPEIPLDLSWTFVLAHPITFAPDGTFTDPSLETALEPGGRLNGEIRALLELATDPSLTPVDVAISPVLLTQLGRMDDGYEVSDGGEVRRVQPGEGGAALAKQALEDLRAIAAAPNVEVTALPFSAPEIPSLYGGGLGRDVGVQLQRGREVASSFVGVQMPQEILRPPGAALDDATLRGLSAAGIRTLLVDPTTVELPEQPLGFAGPATTSLGDGSLAAIVPGSATDALLDSVVDEDPVRATQVLLGELTTIWQEQPGEARGIALLLGEDAPLPGPFFAPMARGIASAPWLAPANAAGFVVTFAPTDTSTLTSPSFRRFPTTYVASLKQARRRIETLRSMLPPSSLEPDRLDTMLLLAEARQFLTSTTDGLAFIEAARESVRATIDDLALDTVPSVTLTSESGGIPVTVSNEGEHSLRFSVRLVSQWIREEPTAEVELGPGDSQTLRLQAELRSTGRFPVLVQMVSPSGRPIGHEALIVRSTAYNRVALLITIGAALVLVGLWAKRFVRRPAT
ncbi:MAG: DUF6049 family protein [Actinomycetota bacterium]